MIKLLHSADWHMDAPLRALAPEQAKLVREEMLRLPGRIAQLCRREGCQAMLLAGDIFDGPYTPESLHAVRSALEETAVPVFIAPGNHDFYSSRSPWYRESWPGNVHIFSSGEMISVSVPELDCRVYGAAFTAGENSGLLRGFHAEGLERYAVAVLHGDPLSPTSPYGPVTALQARESGLDYLALGHIHAGGSASVGAGLMAWPGCPMGHGFDETGVKGVLIAELDETARVRFCPVEGFRFYDFSVRAGHDPLSAAESVLPGVGSRDFYRITFTGEAKPLRLEQLHKALGHFPNLVLRDETAAPENLWEGAGEDSLEGLYFRILRDAQKDADEQTVRALELAAKLSRQILTGQEVELP